MRKEVAAAAVVEALEPQLAQQRLMRTGPLNWKRRTAQGLENLSIDFYKRRYMPKGVAAFSCSFSVTNLQLWPVVKRNLTFMESPGTFGSSIYHVRGCDDGSVVDTLRSEKRLRAGDYGYKDETTLAESISQLKRDVDTYAIPFLRSFPDCTSVAEEIRSRSRKWVGAINESEEIAINALLGREDDALKSLKRSRRINEIGSRLFALMGIGRKAQNQLREFNALEDFIRMIGPDQVMLEEAGTLEEAGDYESANQMFEKARLKNRENDFTPFRQAVMHYRAGRFTDAIEMARDVANRTSLYDGVALELLVKAELTLGHVQRAAGYIERLNSKLEKETEIRHELDVSNFAYWYI